MDNQLPFGGNTVLLCGYFRQILPVVKGGSRAQIVYCSLKRSPLYPTLKVLNLTDNMRLNALRQDPHASHAALQFPQFLLNVGENKAETDNDVRVILPAFVTMLSSVDSLIANVFPNMAQNYTDPYWVLSRAILTVKNSSLPTIHNLAGALIPGHAKTYSSADNILCATEEEQALADLRYPVELLNRLTAGSALPDHQMTLKVGFVVMLRRNLAPKSGDANGARNIIEEMHKHVLILRLATGMYKGGVLTLPRMPCSPGDDSFSIENFVRVQFPVRICFGITTHKAQGQSFSGALGLHMEDDCFSHGQLYVALSRCTHPEKLFVYQTTPMPSLRKVVYPDALPK